MTHTIHKISSSGPRERVPSPMEGNPTVERPSNVPSQRPSRAPGRQRKNSRRRSRTWNERYPDGLAWGNILWLVGLHLGALAAPFTFTWQGLVLLFVLHWMTGGLGVCMGYHRLFTHRSFVTYAPIRWCLAILGALSGEGGVLDWTANHRKHHAHSDQEEDPHSPHDGAWWSHAFWLARKQHPIALQKHYQRWAPDIAREPALRWINSLFLVWHFLLGALVMCAGYALGGVSMAISFLVWGMFVRLVFVLHSTWLVNSASHMWGYRNYETTDDSRNNWWVALITYGEGWHNNHHAYPVLARYGHKWWEIDVTYLTIRLLAWCGLVWDIVDYRRGGRQAA